ncbi:MAG TPA: sugar phosphate isomerase/epimerase family protein [Chthonomonadales bacterium]|nr:sugar phosphate isomerase/epimerase family protein [Chthonomonadales bacterium]
MHLGLVTYNVARDWDFDTLLRICQEAGLEGVEFRTTHAHGVEPTLDVAKRREIRQRCADAGLLQTSLGTVCEFHSPDPEVVKRNIEECARFVLLAKDIGARGVKVRPNALPEGVPVEKTLEQIGKALIECGRFAADHGVEIWVEVHGGGTSLPTHMRKIMDACGHKNVGVTWNSNKTDIINGSVKESFAQLEPFIRCCHINELWSDYPYRELFSLLQQSGYERFILCEVGTPVKPEDGALFLKCYRGLWRELMR